MENALTKGIRAMHAGARHARPAEPRGGERPRRDEGSRRRRCLRPSHEARESRLPGDPPHGSPDAAGGRPVARFPRRAAQSHLWSVVGVCARRQDNQVLERDGRGLRQRGDAFVVCSRCAVERRRRHPRHLQPARCTNSSCCMRTVGTSSRRREANGIRVRTRRSPSTGVRCGRRRERAGGRLRRNGGGAVMQSARRRAVDSTALHDRAVTPDPASVVARRVRSSLRSVPRRERVRTDAHR